MIASKHLLIGFALSALAATVHAIDDRGASADHLARAAEQIDIDSSIKNELKRIFLASLPTYVVTPAVEVTPSDNCARATGNVAVVLSKRVSEPSSPPFSDSFF
jgi:hypothetical protein